MPWTGLAKSQAAPDLEGITSCRRPPPPRDPPWPPLGASCHAQPPPVPPMLLPQQRTSTPPRPRTACEAHRPPLLRASRAATRSTSSSFHTPRPRTPTPASTSPSPLDSAVQENIDRRHAMLPPAARWSPCVPAVRQVPRRIHARRPPPQVLGRRCSIFCRAEERVLFSLPRSISSRRRRAC